MAWKVYLSPSLFGKLSQKEAKKPYVCRILPMAAGYCGELVLNQGAFAPYNGKEQIL